MSETIAMLEMRLLLLKYGRTAVLDALSRIEGTTVEELEREIRAFSNAKRKRAARVPSDSQTVQRLLEARPDLERLVSLYRAKLLLPSLRDVKAFLAAHGWRVSIKTRESALSKVLQVLQELAPEDLLRLEQASGSAHDPGAFSMLADELMSPSKRRPTP